MQLLPLAQSAYARAEQILYKIKTSKYGYDQKHVGNGPGNLVVAKKNNKRNKDKIGIPELKRDQPVELPQTDTTENQKK